MYEYISYERVMSYLVRRLIGGLEMLQRDETDELGGGRGGGGHQRPPQRQRQHGVGGEDDEQYVPHHVLRPADAQQFAAQT